MAQRFLKRFFFLNITDVSNAWAGVDNKTAIKFHFELSSSSKAIVQQILSKYFPILKSFVYFYIGEFNV